MHASNLLEILCVDRCFIKQSHLRSRRFKADRRSFCTVVVDHQRITGEVSLTELIFTPCHSRLRRHPLGLRSVTELFSCHRAPEVPESGRILQEADHAETDTTMLNGDYATRHTDDRKTVELIFVRTRQDGEASAQVHLSIGAGGDAGFNWLAVLLD